jgi:hypothetical protein
MTDIGPEVLIEEHLILTHEKTLTADTDDPTVLTIGHRDGNAQLLEMRFPVQKSNRDRIAALVYPGDSRDTAPLAMREVTGGWAPGIRGVLRGVARAVPVSSTLENDLLLHL